MLFHISQVLIRWINYATAIVELLLKRKKITMENIESTIVDKYTVPNNLITFWIGDDFYNDNITNPIIDAVHRWMLNRSLDKTELFNITNLIQRYQNGSSSERVRLIHTEISPLNSNNGTYTRRQLKNIMFKINS